MKENCYFSVQTDNIQWFSTFVLNHNGAENISGLIAHNFYFFKGFSHLSILNVFLRLNCGFNFKGINSCIKRKYFSDLNYVLRKKVRRTIMTSPSDAVKLSELFRDKRINYFPGRIEDCYMTIPDSIDYNISRSFVLPDITLERDMFFEKKKKNRIESLRSDDSTDSNFSHNSDKGEYLDIPNLSVEHAPDHSLQPLTNIEEFELKTSNDWISLNADIVLKDYKELKIREFEYMDVNHFNLPFLMREQFLDILNDGEEQKNVSDKFFKFLYGVRVFEKKEKLGAVDEFGEAMRYVQRRVAEISGIDFMTVSPTAKEIHFKLLSKLELINESAKQSVLGNLNNRLPLIELKEELNELYYEKCIIMIEIRSLYTKHAYIQDCYLARRTDYQLDFDFCGFLRAVNKMNSIRKGMSESSETRKGLTVYEAGFSPSINEIKSKGRKSYTIREAREVAAKHVAISEDEYEQAIEHSNSVMGVEWTQNFINDLVNEKIKSEDEDLVKLKAEYNCLIKNRGKWGEEDTEYFHLILQSIFEHDEEFIKYMPNNLKKNFEEKLKEVKMHFSFINSCCTNHPNYTSSELTQKEKPKAVRDSKIDKILNIFSQVTGVNDKGEIGTIKGGVGIFDNNESETDLEKRRINWLNSKNNAIDHTNTLVESIVEIYHYLGDALELTPQQLGLKTVNCSCYKQDHVITYKNTLLKGLNRVSSRKIQIAKKKQELESNYKIVESLTKKKEIYLKSINEEKGSEFSGLKKENLQDPVSIKSDSGKGWLKAKDTSKKTSIEKNSPKGIECLNRFDCLYENKDEILDAERLADKFLSVSENLNIIFDWKRYKSMNKHIKKKIEELQDSGEAPNCNVLNKIKTNNGSSPLKKYRVSNIRDVLVVIHLCYNKKIYPDFSYLKEEFGIKRCQSKFLMISLNIMMKRISEEDKSRRGKKGKDDLK